MIKEYRKYDTINEIKAYTYIIRSLKRNQRSLKGNQRSLKEIKEVLKGNQESLKRNSKKS